MEKRFEYCNSHYICDNKNGEHYTDDDLVCLADLLNEQDEKIKELEHSQNQKAIEVLEDIKKQLEHMSSISVGAFDDLWDIYKNIKAQIEELRGKENE